jgi:hypothetical protein
MVTFVIHNTRMPGLVLTPAVVVSNFIGVVCLLVAFVLLSGARSALEVEDAGLAGRARVVLILLVVVLVIAGAGSLSSVLTPRAMGVFDHETVTTGALFRGRMSNRHVASAGEHGNGPDAPRLVCRWSGVAPLVVWARVDGAHATVPRRGCPAHSSAVTDCDAHTRTRSRACCCCACGCHASA